MPTGSFLLGVDVGSSGSKAGIFDLEGRRIALHYAEYDHSVSETEINGFIDDVCHVIRDTVIKSKIDPAEISGIGLGAFVGGLVAIDKDGTECMVWTDRDVSTETESIRQSVDCAKQAKLPGRLESQLLSIKIKQPRIYQMTSKFLQMKDYVEFKLTGQAATDWSEASLTMLFDPKKRVWSDDLVANIGLDIERLPKIVPSTSVIGEITNTIAEKTNLMKGTPVVAGGIDDAISILGLNALETGVASNVSGTVENLDVCVDRIIPEKPEYLRSGIEFLCNVIPNSYIIHVGSFLSGGFLRWFRDQLGKVEVDRAKGLQVDPFVVMDKEAEEIPIGSDGLIAEPPASVYIVGEYSYDGSLQGLSTRHRRGHIIRAILEGIAFNLKEDLDIMKKLGVPVQKVVASGGCSRSTILNQIKSDILGVPIFLTEETEPGVLGAAILAGVGAGIYANPTIAAGKMVMEKENHFEPLHKAEYSKILNRRNRILAS